MPWLTIFMTLLTFFLAGGDDKEKRTTALAAAAGVGLGTYYTTHETDWGKTNLGSLDGVVPTAVAANPVIDATGQPVVVDGNAVKTNSGVTAGSSASVWDTLKSWGAAGTAAVVGVGVGAATGTNWLLIGGLAVVAYLLLKG